MSGLPPLPRIDGDLDLMLDVYTHSSLRFGTAPQNDDYGDTDRLAELGAKVLELVVTYHLFSVERPMLSQEGIQAKRDTILAPQSIDVWLDSYGLKQKLRASPNDLNDLLNNPAEMTKYFHIYIGALYIRNGLPVVQKWVSALITPGADIKPPEAPFENGGAYQPMQPMPQHYPQQMHGYPSPPPSQAYSLGYSQGSGYPSSPPPGHAPAPPSTAPPPLPGSPPTFNYTASSPLSLVTLALVNQTAAQKGFTVTYPAQQVGPSHLPTWTVKCCLNGEERGQGVGKSQKAAKEDAARMAWANMGWGPT